MTTFITRLLAALLAILFSSCREGQQQDQAKTQSQTKKTEGMQTIFVGTYTKKEDHLDGQAEGILTVYQNPETGELQSGETVAQVTNPSFVKVSETGNRLLAVSELGSAHAPSEYIYSYRILENDSLEQISKLPTESFAPAHIELDQTGSLVFVSNYMGGVVMMYRLNNDGSLEKQ